MPPSATSQLFPSRICIVLGALVTALWPVAASAQTITTDPIAPVPVMGPWALLVLSALLIAITWRLLRRREARRATIAVVLAGTAVVAAWQATTIYGQLVSTFTNPEGETLEIPVEQLTTSDGITGFQAADFTNDSGVDLLIREIVLPDFDACFPRGLTDALLPPDSSDPSPHPACVEDETLANGETCRVDVEAICRAIADENAPTITTVTPTSGPTAGGTTVTVAGTNLTGASNVSFGANEATSFTVDDDETITAVAPAGNAGVVDVLVVTPRGSVVATAAFTYVAPSAPTLAEIVPSAGPTSGGTTVTLTGTNLTGATEVTFAGTAATNVTVVDATTVTADTPAHAVGPVDVVVTTPNGSATLAAGFTYEAVVELTALLPASGSASGGTGFILTGVNLTGATGVLFDGVAATSVNVVNSTTVTGVTPAHAAGAVDVTILTPNGDATLVNGYQYLVTAVGQPSGGGIIAVLNGGLNNLIAATADQAVAVPWSPTSSFVLAQSITDGASNTAAIVAAVGSAGGAPYAALVCNDYEVDSQGNTPCQAGNACYNDWFLPAGINPTATGQLHGLFVNRTAIGGFTAGLYWSSTEFDIAAAWTMQFAVGADLVTTKTMSANVRCVRAFTP